VVAEGFEGRVELEMLDSVSDWKVSKHEVDAASADNVKQTAAGE
jgi:hypothetical protein